MKKCYYAVLDVDKKATGDEIKQSYRKQALIWHPDKNQSEEATIKFQAINEAYTVLSDPNERTWYDNHRDQILKNNQFNNNAGNNEEDDETATFGFDPWPYFSTSCFSGFNDSEKGFYTVYRDVFEKIKSSEENAKQSYTKDDEDDEDIDLMIGGKSAPGFGDSKTGIDSVLEFYKFWDNFHTFKQFGWKDLYNLSEAYNRQVKRVMEKENKKERTKERKAYLDAMKELVQFVKKRDPRYQDYAKAQMMEKIKKAEDLKNKEDAQRKKMTELREKQRQEEAKRYTEELKNNKNENNVQTIAEPVHFTEFYCDVCEKEYRTENQLDNHKKSKAHQLRVKELYAEVALEEEKEELEEDQPEKDEAPKKKKARRKKHKKNQAANGDEEESSKPKEQTQQSTTKSPTKQEKDDSEDTSSDDEADMLSYLGNNLKKAKAAPKKTANTNNQDIAKEVIETPVIPAQTTESPNSKWPIQEEETKESPTSKWPIQEEETKETVDAQPESVDVKPEIVDAKPVTVDVKPVTVEAKSEPSAQKKPLNKAKLKKLKKEEKAAQEKASPHVCHVCNEEFESKTKLFQHVKDEDHATVKEEKVKEKPAKEKPTAIACLVCKEEFESKSKLFQHVKDKGHAVVKT